MSTLIINDLHLGVRRTSGTTIQSQQALGDYLHTSFSDLINQHKDKDLLILGDLFDGFNIDPRDLILCFTTLADWVKDSGRKLTLVSGNHDYSAKATKISSFELLCHFLTSQFAERVVVINHENGYTEIMPGVGVIPHCLNQDLFDVELQRALDSGSEGWLLLHCNVKNNFAEQSDHSLNLNEEWANKLSKQFRLMVAHEHQQKDYDDIVVIGNQFPSSISDCLGNITKRCLVLEDDLGFTEVKTWNVLGDFAEHDWQDLGDHCDQRFIRINGTAVLEQATEVVNAIAKFRSRSSALVVSNAVKIEGMPDMEELASMSVENVKAFDVFQALLDCLTEDESKVIKEVMDA